ncbi:MAG: molybdopterin-dependent oxidoreductase [Acidobacteria bacterium]|uniref:Molybdopterin-dependent oxidoreductase n=1 Tax=Candidatus Polarisedimenticola svalbardensis TaxID=2886004 RepID=A0A8J6Y5N4_9BACT|nr:molybdopterin-dependent oxidoreductase [Candidatus Polarisedimenticola svalbardensis]
MAISRRDFLAGTAGATIGFGLGALSHQFPLAPPQVGPDWRPGKETFRPSTCMLCPAHCGIQGRLVDGELSRIDGNPLHPVSRGGLCPKGRAGIQMLYHPGRLRGPVERIGPPGSEEFRSISWEEASGRVATAIRSARGSANPGTIEFLAGNTTGVMKEVVSMFCRTCGTDRILVDDYRDGSADVMQLCQGIDTPPAFDLAGSDLVLSFGASLAESWWSLPLAAGARGSEAGSDARWIQADVRMSRSAAGADQWIPVHPGTYGTLALGIAYLILKEGLYDADTVSRHVLGWEDWTGDDGIMHAGFRTLALRHGPPDMVAARTGVPPRTLAGLAKSFGTARRPVAVWDHAVSWRAGGLSDALAIHALNILVGGLNRPGGVLIQPTLPLSGEHMPGTLSAGGPELSNAALTSTTWPSEEGADASPSPQVLFLYQSNPVASNPNADEVRRALSKIPLVVSFSPFLDQTARHADLILPDHVYLERWQDAPSPSTVPFPVWGIVQPVTPPIHDTRATGDVMLDLIARLDGSNSAAGRFSSVERMVRARGQALAGAHRGSAFVEPIRREELRQLEERGWWLPHGEEENSYWDSMLAAGGWFDPFYDYHDRSGASRHPDGKVWIFPAEARRRLGDSGESLAEGFLPIRTGPVQDDHAKNPYPLQMVPFRVQTLASGGTPLMPWLLENLGVLTGNRWETWIEVNPETATEHEILQGQRVRVESRVGAFEAAVKVFPGAQPGVINVPYGLHTSVSGWGNPRGSNPLRAVGKSVDPVTGLPDWYSTRVRLVPV